MLRTKLSLAKLFGEAVKVRSSKVCGEISLHLKSSGLYYKTFRIVIYDRNDSTIVEPVL